jgi:hypothetical protein
MLEPIQRGTQQHRIFDGLRRSGWAGVLFVAMIGPVLGCSGLPSMEDQERHVRNNELVLNQLTPPAFVKAWGMPAYQRIEFMQFFGMKDGEWIPRSRLASGETPRGWEVRIEAGDALFLAYPDHGWLVVFLGERLVYRESLTAEKLHELGRSWHHEDKFRSRFESPTTQ